MSTVVAESTSPVARGAEPSPSTRWPATESGSREPTIDMGMVVLVGIGITVSALVIHAVAAGLTVEA